MKTWVCRQQPTCVASTSATADHRLAGSGRTSFSSQSDLSDSNFVNRMLYTDITNCLFSFSHSTVFLAFPISQTLLYTYSYSYYILCITLVCGMSNN